LFAVRDGTNELLGKRLFFKPDLGWMVKCPKREPDPPPDPDQRAQRGGVPPEQFRKGVGDARVVVLHVCANSICS
jgi:hypothetical protein